jgi:hypothetical protein
MFRYDVTFFKEAAATDGGRAARKPRFSYALEAYAPERHSPEALERLLSGPAHALPEVIAFYGVPDARLSGGAVHLPNGSVQGQVMRAAFVVGWALGEVNDSGWLLFSLSLEGMIHVHAVSEAGRPGGQTD